MQAFQFFIIDDHKILTSGLSSFLTANFSGSSCLATFESAKACLDFLGKNKNAIRNVGTGGGIAEPLELPEQRAFAELPLLAIVDLNLSGLYSFPLIKELAGQKIKVLVYTMFESTAFATRSIECGASAYILKGEDEAGLVAAIQSVLDGKTFITPSLEKNFVQMMKIMSAFSPKEKSVAEHLIDGKDNAEIAEAMRISKRSVENYLSHMYDKAGVFSRDELKTMLK